MVKIAEPAVLLEEYRRLLQTEDAITALPLQVSGNSMSPFLAHGRDTVYLSRLTRPPRRGDILLYRRDNGSYVLHRVHRGTEESLTLCGDGQVLPEPGIRPDQVIACVSAVCRRGKTLRPGDLSWDFYEKIWPRLRLPRMALSVLRRRLGL